MPASSDLRYRFDRFELETRPSRLTVDGEDVPLQPQPARALELLVSRAGDLVSRDELRDHLWGEDVHLEHEQAINFTIRRIRAALGDDARTRRFIETVPRQGYRFVAPVECLGSAIADGDGHASAALTSSTAVPPPTIQKGQGEPVGSPQVRSYFRASWVAGLILLTLALTVGWVYWDRLRAESSAVEVPASAKTETDLPKLAVLPFEAVADDDTAQSLAEVLSEELVAHLTSRLAPVRSNDGSGPPGVAVVTLRSSRTVRHEEPEVAGRRLGADLLLGGTLVRQGQGLQGRDFQGQDPKGQGIKNPGIQEDELRLSARLWRVGDRVHVWADTFTVRADAVQSVWDRIADGVGEAVGWQGPVPRSKSAGSLGAEQQRELWQARMAVSTGEEAKVEDGIARLESLAVQAPRSAEVRLALSQAWMEWGGTGGSPYGRQLDLYFPQVERWAREVVALDPQSADAWLHLAATRFYCHLDWPATRRLLEEKVLRLSPRHAGGLHLYGIYLSTLGKFGEGIETIQRAVDLDPATLFVVSDLHTAYLAAGRFDQAVTQVRQNLRIAPDERGHVGILVEALRLQGRGAEALTEIQGFFSRYPMQIESLDQLDQLSVARLRERVDDGEPALTDLARYQVMVGDLEAALDSLEKACSGKPDFNLPWLAVYPRFDPLRNHPRYRALAKCLAPTFR